MKKSSLLLVGCVFALCLFHQNVVAQCFPDGNDVAPASFCPATIPVPACAPPLPAAAACPIDDLTFTTSALAAPLTWTCPVGCPACPGAPFDVARGSIDCLRASHNAVPDTCVDGDAVACPGGLAAPPFASPLVAAIPPVGSAYWYLVRVSPPLCGGSSWNSSGVVQCTDYDPVCPACMGCPPGCPP